jgi:hypothetical protein
VFEFAVQDLRGHKDEEERRGSRGDDQQHDEGVTKRVHAALTHWCRMSCNTIVDIPTSTPMLHAEGYANAGR